MPSPFTLNTKTSPNNLVDRFTCNLFYAGFLKVIPWLDRSMTFWSANQLTNSFWALGRATTFDQTRRFCGVVSKTFDELAHVF